YMAGAVAEFSRKYPEVSVEVHSSFEDVDLLADSYDLTVRYDQLENSSMIARRLGGHVLCLCASPAYWESHGQPSSADDLGEHNCLATTERYWLFDTPDSNDIRKVKISGNWISEDGANLLAAARAGLGIAQLPVFYINEAVAKGELVKLEQQWSYYHRMAWAVFPNSRHLSAKVRFFVDFLVEYLHNLEDSQTADLFR
ncbi:MAG: LysR family transcriptional regulator, partial [Halioglobus sp.]|nr:LysR family transcriptional regulator [Halioglobus sp.]